MEFEILQFSIACWVCWLVGRSVWGQVSKAFSGPWLSVVRCFIPPSHTHCPVRGCSLFLWIVLGWGLGWLHCGPCFVSFPGGSGCPIFSRDIYYMLLIPPFFCVLPFVVVLYHGFTGFGCGLTGIRDGGVPPLGTVRWEVIYSVAFNHIIPLLLYLSRLSSCLMQMQMQNTVCLSWHVLRV